MGQALYRKYRSKSLSEIVGQEHITSTLERAINSGRISHAYLFTGPKGVGKTSIARILAHEINGLPYTDESAHMDIIEIDAASNRRIDEIRELREKVYVAPTSAKYKVYIIDEVHMLTREAFNALLKTLEEPPAHVVFILATTDAHKVPETIVSRTQRFTFKPVEPGKVIAHLRHIATEEKIKISDEALQLLAEHGEGSFRDSISMLDQASNHGRAVEPEDVRTLLGIPPAKTISGLAATLQTGNSAQLLQLLIDLYEQGYQAAGIAKQLAEYLRKGIVAGDDSLHMPVVLQLLGKLIEVPASHDPERYLEIILLEALPRPQNVPPKPQALLEPETLVIEQVVDEQPLESTLKPERSQKSQVKEATKSASTASAGTDAFDENLWPQILSALKQKHNTIYSIVRMARPTFSNDRLVLAFAFAFHQKRLNDAKHRKLLADTIYELSGQNVSIECVYDKDLAKSTPVATKETGKDPTLNAISNIFGGGELLES